MCTRLQNEKRLKIDQIQSDHGKEFENSYMESFCTRSGISQEFSAPITLQQNGVVEKKNKVIQEMARAMLHNMDVARNLWGEAINTMCHMVNRVYFRPGTRKTPNELWKGRKPNVKYFKIFESTCFILNDREMWKNLTPEAMKGYLRDTPLQARLIGIQQKNQEGDGNGKCCYR